MTTLSFEDAKRLLIGKILVLQKYRSESLGKKSQYFITYFIIRDILEWDGIAGTYYIQAAQILLGKEKNNTILYSLSYTQDSLLKFIKQKHLTQFIDYNCYCAYYLME